ncbi:MAG: GAP family protein [Candidatus Pacearchaeota archaeon]|nr:GAP family protein [Candidatus Pacearchaeota archaeon]
MADLSLISVIGFALVDAINPCELAVMVLVLMSILLANPADKKKVLSGGLAFSIAVFIMYFIYGVVIVQFFSHLIPATGKISLYIFKVFGLFAIILGLLNIKDYLNYKPGSFATEMPISFRPKMRNLVKKVTSIRGAFVVGLLVTIFLAPCTMGPYLIVSAKLSGLSFLATIPYLLLYNLIFILPMIALTLAIYFGLTTLDSVSEWRERKIQKIHLIEGAILIILGIVMFTGLI